MKSRRVVIIFLVLLGLWGLLIAKAIYVQVIPNDRLTQLREKSFKRIVHLKSRRGAIFDQNHRELAVSISSYSLYADPMVIKDPRRASRKLGRYFRRSSSRYYKKLKNKNKRFVWLARRLSKKHRDKIKSWKIHGLAFIEEPTRVYPNDQLLSHLLGFVGEEGGLEGLELIYDDILRGENRRLRFYKDARGRPLLVNGQVFLDHPDGADLHLTIDSGLQFKLEKELHKAMDDFEASSAVGVVLDAETSAVLAMANLPTFNANKPTSFPDKIRRNRAVTDSFEPGSTFKTFTIAGALSHGVVQPNTKINCENGKLKIGRQIIHEADSEHKFDFLTVSGVLAQSSNIGSAKIAFKLGDKKLREFLESLGFGKKTGVDLPGEAKGILHKTPWRKHLLSNISFGHGVTATPLQMAAAYGAIANGGVLKKPYIVQSIVSSDSGVREDFGPEIVRRVLTPELASTMKFMLAGATLPGATGVHGRVHGFPVAGKTGTAQKVRTDGRGYVPNQYISSFAGFIPVNKPKYVIYIAVDSPRKSYYGSQVAAPVFSRIASYAVLKAELAPVLLNPEDIISSQKTTGRSIYANPSEKTKIEKDNKKTKDKQIKLQQKALASLHHIDFKEGVVPPLMGLSLREAYRQIAGTDIQLKVRGSGVIAKMSPRVGQSLPRSKTVRVRLESPR